MALINHRNFRIHRRVFASFLALTGASLVGCEKSETSSQTDDDDDGVKGCGDNTQDALPEILEWDDASPDPTVAVQSDPQTFENEFQEVLAAAVRFYGAQRSGAGPNWVLDDNEHGQECFMEDGKDLGDEYDLTGGWHDAGDYLKYTNNNAYAALALLRAHDLFPDAFKDFDDPEYGGEPNGIPDVLDETRYALDYLEKMLIDDERFVFRVGDKRDHLHWFTAPRQSQLGPADGGGKRPTQVNGQADVAGISAAALAAGAVAFKELDAEASERYLKAATAQLAYAEAHQEATNDPDDFYDDDSYLDSLLCAYTELYRATGESEYLDQAKAASDEIGNTGWFLDWSNVTALCRIVLVQEGDSASQETYKEEVEGLFSYATDASENACLRGLFVYKDEDSGEYLTWGTIRYSLGVAYATAMAWKADLDPEVRQQFANVTKSQVEWTLGANQYERNFIVGIDETSPKFPHHKNAYGRELDVFPKKGAAVGLVELKGALVGGPAETGYEDDIANYQTNEVTIDYNAMLVGALAARAHMALVEESSR
jgi:hypothetical protein